MTPGSDWKMGDSRKPRRPMIEVDPQSIIATPTVATQNIGALTVRPTIADERQAKLDVVFARIDSELALSPEALREHLKVSASGATSLRATCKSLLDREQTLRVQGASSQLCELSFRNYRSSIISLTTRLRPPRAQALRRRGAAGGSG